MLLMSLQMQSIQLQRQSLHNEIVSVKDKKEIKDFAKGFNSMVGYRFNDEHRFLHYIPLERNNWYMMSSIPTQFVVMQAQRLTGLSLVLFGTIFLVFFGIIFYLFYLFCYFSYCPRG